MLTLNNREDIIASTQTGQTNAFQTADRVCRIVIWKQCVQ